MVRVVEATAPLLATLRLLVPPLAPDRYKGQAGKVAVIGGCADYTGAPYYAAISALKLGVRCGRRCPATEPAARSRASCGAHRPT